MQEARGEITPEELEGVFQVFKKPPARLQCLVDRGGLHFMKGTSFRLPWGWHEQSAPAKRSGEGLPVAIVTSAAMLIGPTGGGGHGPSTR